MDWFLYDNGLRHERVKQLRFCEKKKIFLWPMAQLILKNNLELREKLTYFYFLMMNK